MGRVGNVSRDLYRPKAGGGVRAARIPKEDATDEPKRSRSGERAVRTPEAAQPLTAPPEYEEFASVWEALGFSEQEAAHLEARAGLMLQIEAIVRQAGWTQAEAAKRCGVTQPRINDLLRGHIDRFSLDALVNIAAALGRRVRIQLDAA